MSKTDIVLRGAQAKNLHEVDCAIPRGKLTIVTGPSGSGKSTLVFDILKTEAEEKLLGPFRPFEHLPQNKFAGVRQVRVRELTGVPFPFSVERKISRRSRFTTVGTMAKVYEDLGALCYRYGEPHCTDCGRMVSAHSVRDIYQILAASTGESVQIFIPLSSEQFELSEYEKLGFSRVALGDELLSLDQFQSLAKIGDLPESAALFIDSVSLPAEPKALRILDSLDAAYRYGSGHLQIRVLNKERELLWKADYYREFHCEDCRKTLRAVTREDFLFHRKRLSCSGCHGTGEVLRLRESAAAPLKASALSKQDGFLWASLRENLSRKEWSQWMLSLEIFSDIAPQKFTEQQQALLLWGTNGAEQSYFSPLELPSPLEDQKLLPLLIVSGLFGYCRVLYQKKALSRSRKEIEVYLRSALCPCCRGARVSPLIASRTISGTAFGDLLRSSLKEISDVVSRWEGEIGSSPLARRLRRKLALLQDLGLFYLPLNRNLSSVSCGEWQRLQLAREVDGGLEGVMYLIDEPTTGLHVQEQQAIYRVLRKLVEKKNTVIVVDHALEMIRSADHLIEFGPGAGRRGGRIVYEGNVDGMQNKHTLTSALLVGWQQGIHKRATPYPTKFLHIEEMSLRTLDIPRLSIPLECMTVVQGVSGSGKSTAFVDSIAPALRVLLQRQSHGGAEVALRADEQEQYGIKNISGLAELTSLELCVEKTSRGSLRSTVGSVTGVYRELCQFFAGLPEARMRGWKSEDFSMFGKGACSTCAGLGYRRKEEFLEFGEICPNCLGTRLQDNLSQVTFKGFHLAQILELPVEDAEGIFRKIPKLSRLLSILRELRLGYVPLAQRLGTLSGGEVQRLRLFPHLQGKHQKSCLYIFDEPTHGLHFEDVKQLIRIFEKLIAQKHTVIVIEHHPCIVASADWNILFGPEAGEYGGKLVSAGINSAAQI